MMKKKKVKNKDSKVEEPIVAYLDEKRIHFFNSFEEKNEFDAMERAKNTPLENLKNTTELIKMVFAKELKKKYNPKKIHFR
jgi:hypothetical protein